MTFEANHPEPDAGVEQLHLLPDSASTARPWSPSEDDALRRAYTTGGSIAALAALPGRSLPAIYNRALKLKLRSARQKGTVRHTWPHLPEIDADIHAAHARGIVRGAWKTLAQRWGRPQWYISQRAADLGLTVSNTRTHWSDDELELIHSTAHLGASRAAVIFRRKGHARSATAIQTKRWQIGASRGHNGLHTGRALATLLGCSSNHITRSIRSGALRATSAGTGSEAMHSIKERDIRAWLIANPCALDLRRVPPAAQPWLISVLGGRFAHD